MKRGEERKKRRRERRGRSRGVGEGGGIGVGGIRVQWRRKQKPSLSAFVSDSQIERRRRLGEKPP